MKYILSIALLAAVTACPSVCLGDDKAEAKSYAAKTQGKTIVDVAAANKDFSTLVAAVKAAGLAEKLASDGPFTVFAPTNAAFGKLPKDQLQSLLKPENKEKLQSILLYHVAAAKVVAADVTQKDEVETANGKTIRVSTTNGAVMLNDKAKVVKTDIMADNGVIHVIDTVILPPANN